AHCSSSKERRASPISSAGRRSAGRRRKRRRLPALRRRQIPCVERREPPDVGTELMSGIFMLKGRAESRLLAAVALAVTAGPASGDPPASPERSYIEHRSPPGSPALPFNDAVRSGDMLYVAGHLGIDPKTGSVPSDAEGEILRPEPLEHVGVHPGRVPELERGAGARGKDAEKRIEHREILAEIRRQLEEDRAELGSERRCGPQKVLQEVRAIAQLRD